MSRMYRQVALKSLLFAVVFALVGSGSVALAAGPAAPNPLAPLNGAQVTVPFTNSWSAVSDPSGIIAYNWEVSPSSSFVPVAASNSTSGQTQSTVSGLTNGTYFWRVQAVNGAFTQGAWSTPQRFTVTGGSAGAPGVPTLNPPKGGTAFHPMETISFTWSAVPGAASYIFDAANDANFPVSTKVHFDNIPNTFTGLTLGDSMPQGTWFARVQAVDANGVAGQPSSNQTFTLSFNAPLPPPPTPLTPADGAQITLPVTMTWTDVPNPQLSGYVLEIADDPGFSAPLAYVNNQITGPHWTVTSLTAGTKFWHVLSTQGDSAPGVPANTAFSTTRSFVVPSTPMAGSLAVSTASPFSGDTETVTVQLTAPAPAGGAVVNLTSSDTTAAPLPATFTMPAGFAFGQFQFQTGQVTAARPVTLTASINGTSASTSFTLQPPSLKSLFASSPITGGVPASGIISLNGLAPTGGAVVSLTSSSSAANPPATATVAPGAASLSFNIPTTAVTTTTTATLTATWQGQSVQTVLTLTPQQPPQSLTLSPTTATGTAGSFATVTLASAPTSDVSLPIASSNPSVARINNFVTIPAGTTRAGFDVFTTLVNTPTNVTISVSGAGVTQSAVLTVNPSGTPPPASGPSLSAVSLNPSTVPAGSSSQGTVTFTSAVSAATSVSLSSSNSAAASVPATVTVAAGATRATFTATTKAVSTTTAVTITAALGGASTRASLSVTSAATDTVSVQGAEYVVKDQVLGVRATSTSSSATLTAYDGSSGATIGRLSNKGAGSYEGQLSWPTTPKTIVVRSSLGGSASSAVTPK